jgi:FAD/FMN-containing dehydrogenase
MLATAFGFDPEPWIQHRRAVAAICEIVASTSRHQTRNMHAQKAPYNAPSDMLGLDKIVQIDLDTCTAWVEPNVTMETLAQATLRCGLVPAVVAASRSVTVADAFAATTTASSSFKFGTFDCTVLSLEAILSNGQYVMATINDRDTSDLLFGSAGAMHSLALTTLLEIALIPASSYVEVTYWSVFSVSGAMRKTRQVGRDSSMPRTSAMNSTTDFVESVMFDASSGIVATGRFASTADHTSIPQSPEGNSFIQHARSVWHETRYARGQHVDVVHIMEYLFRHDDCDTNNHVQNKRHADRQDRPNPVNQAHTVVLQDIGLPLSDVREHIHRIHETQSIWPIRIYPVRPPQDFGRRSFGVGPTFEQVFWNLRFYSSNATCDGIMERALRDMHGFRYLHSRAPRSEDTVWVFHDDRWYSRLRSRWKAQGLPDINKRLGTLQPLICV